MAYADQSISNRRIVGLVLVGLLHLGLLYVLVTGLGTNIYKKAIADLKTFDVKDEPPPPPDKPPPPPPEQKQIEPPPMVTPPTIVQTPTIAAPVMQQVQVAPPVQIHVEAPPAPAPPRISQAAAAKGDPNSWITNEDYPSDALREEKDGVSAIAWDINSAGRVENCHVTSPSGTASLDEAACKLITRRGRYAPAKDENGQPIVSHSRIRFRWVLPRE